MWALTVCGHHYSAINVLFSAVSRLYWHALKKHFMSLPHQDLHAKVAIANGTVDLLHPEMLRMRAMVDKLTLMLCKMAGFSIICCWIFCSLMALFSTTICTNLLFVCK
jgi:hypothetical protein